MARKFLIIGSIVETVVDNVKKVGIVGTFIGDEESPDNKKNLIGKKITIKTKNKDIATFIKGIYINHTLADVYVISIETDLKSKKDLLEGDLVFLE
jgi:hypothetical protein